jgi:hypothetical protein
MRTDDPYAGSFARATNAGLTVRFDAVSECGMGGPVWGALTIGDSISLPRAFPCVVVDEVLCVAAFQELEMSGLPRVVIHIRQLPNGPSVQHSLPFGAYVFTDVTSQSVGVFDQWTKQRYEFVMPQNSRFKL